MARRILHNALLIDPARGLEEEGALIIEDGRIERVLPASEGPFDGATDAEVEDLGGRWLVPGLVDLRASLGEPGHEQREDIASGLAAAAGGGFTHVCATPDTEPPVDREAVVHQLLARARQAEAARLLPVAAATVGFDDKNLAPLGELAEAGCVAVTQGERPIGSAGLLRRLLEYASVFDLVVMETAVEPTLAGMIDEGRWSTRLGLPPTPAAAELIMVQRDLLLSELTGARLHLSRVSTRIAVEAIAAAKQRGVPVTCDVTPHHLHLTTSALVDYDPNTKVWPPLRSEDDRAALREALASGTIDAVASDHRPMHAEEKVRDFQAAETGIIGLETSLSLVLALVADGTLTPRRAVEVLSSGPRKVLGLEGGTLAPGAPADVTVIDPEGTWIVDGASLRSRSHNTPFEGQALRGMATSTWVGGQPVWRASTEDL